MALFSPQHLNIGFLKTQFEEVVPDVHTDRSVREEFYRYNIFIHLD